MILSEDILDKIQIYFSNELHDINLMADSVDKIIIKDGFLMVHDICENDWHCYNINHVSHFHYPDYMKGPAK